MTCTMCGTQNPQGTLFCNICFAPLNSGNTIVSNSSLQNSSVSIMATGQKSINKGDISLHIGPPVKKKPRLIILENTEPTGQSINLPSPPYNSEISIGRTDLKNSIVVDIDVNSFAGFDKGVSRKHARISYSNSNFFIEDWNSKLGTFVNKEKLATGVQKTIKEGDEIRFANLITKFEFSC